jgi:hypothetical protein
MVVDFARQLGCQVRGLRAGACEGEAKFYKYVDIGVEDRQLHYVGCISMGE